MDAEHSLKNSLQLAGCAVIALTAISTAASADIFFNHEPGSPVSLGRSVDYRNPSETKVDCLSDLGWSWVELDTLTDSAVGGVMRVNVSGRYTDDLREITERLHLNAAAKANAAITDAISGGVDATLNVKYDFLGSYADFAYMLVASYDFGSRRLTRASLLPKYQDLLNEGRHDEFIAECGTHYAVNEEMWAYAALIVNIERLDETVKRHLLATYRSEATIVDVASGSLSLGIHRAWDSARKYGLATLEFEANGGDPTRAADLAQATQSNEISPALAAMRGYLEGISRDTSVPKRIRLASFSSFGLEIDEDPARDRFLESVYFSGLRYQLALDAVRSRLSSILESAHTDLELQAIYERDLALLGIQKGALDQLAANCVRDNECDVERIREVAPLIAYRTSLLRAPELQSVCLYHNDALAAISIRLLGQFVDPEAVQDFEVYRLSRSDNGEAVRLDVARTSLTADPDSHRFVARLEIAEADPLNSLPLREEVRANRYEMKVTVFDGSVEWYNLGYPRIRSDECPNVRN